MEYFCRKIVLVGVSEVKHVLCMILPKSDACGWGSYINIWSKPVNKYTSSDDPLAPSGLISRWN